MAALTQTAVGKRSSEEQMSNAAPQASRFPTDELNPKPFPP